MGMFKVLVNVPLILPEPVAGIPGANKTLFLIQVKVVPVTFPLNSIGVIDAPEQMV